MHKYDEEAFLNFTPEQEEAQRQLHDEMMRTDYINQMYECSNFISHELQTMMKTIEHSSVTRAVIKCLRVRKDFMDMTTDELQLIASEMQNHKQKVEKWRNSPSVIRALDSLHESLNS